MNRYHIIVSGKVQGVGFRYYTQKQAKKHSITGWVRNKTDGTVEAEAQGTEEKIRSFLKAVKKGSRSSEVKSVDVQPLSKLNDYTIFEIIR